tara:strand:- start:266 stop:550 length:285 start_codon:yes stop_codon:yes gene_type:complete
LKGWRRGRRGHRHARRHKRGPEERDTTRVQLELPPPQAMERLQQLKDKTEAASYAEVIRNALRLYEALIQEADRGAEFQVKQPDGEAALYRIFL